MTPQHRLISIPASHYVERARWALDYAGIAFTEDKYPPMLHLVGTLSVSSAGGPKTHSVPMLLCPPGQHAPGQQPQQQLAIRDSADIVRYAHDCLEKRRAAAGSPPDPAPTPASQPPSTTAPATASGPASTTAPATASGPALPPLAGGAGSNNASGPPSPTPEPAPSPLPHPLYPSDPDEGGCDDNAAADAAAAGGGGGPYLVGGRFTAADLTFASMAAVLLLPPQYGAYMPPPEAWPPAAELRGTAAGRHALRMYEQHRAVGGL
ncbi:hypothetical protein TSOC_007669 [Tetrabaena socialis]|uniref:GST N-terminal domain-containing protein n=1 Tax=Tetrabaena socialis TaxID=47790 RepID=A0A2J8A0G6_9CHLO|nr:hypothetical protein TSOC_007669 [Tetrabaena socialis]|eukprot:PNH06009.1 hypothetical protein TSOC_007669 [Tetrabaena socialis]